MQQLSKEERYNNFGGLLKAYSVFLTVFIVWVLFRSVLFYVEVIGWMTDISLDFPVLMILILYAVIPFVTLLTGLKVASKLKSRDHAVPVTIVKAIGIYAAIMGLFIIIRLIFTVLIADVEATLSLNFLSEELTVMMETLFFSAVSILYFRWSARVKQYYSE